MAIWAKNPTLMVDIIDKLKIHYETNREEIEKDIDIMMDNIRKT